MQDHYETAELIHNQLLAYYDALFEEGNPAGLKCAMEIMGLCSKEVRLPLVAGSELLETKMKDILGTLK